MDSDLKSRIEKLKQRRYPYQNSEGKWGYTDVFGKVVEPAHLDEKPENPDEPVKGARELDTNLPLTLRQLINDYTSYPLGDNDKITDNELFWECVYNRKKRDVQTIKTLGPINPELNIRREEKGLCDFAMFGWVRYGAENNDKKEIIFCDYDDIFPMSEGLIRVAQYNIPFIGLSPFTSKFFGIGFIEDCLDADFRKIAEETLKLRWGFIDERDREIIPIEYDAAKDFHDGVAAVCKNEEWGYIDKSNNVIIPFFFEWAGDFQDGFARVLYAGLYYVIDKDGYCYESFEEIESGIGSKFYL